MTKRFPILNNNYYHLYNKGVEKQTVFLDNEDFVYFLKLLQFFNTKKSLGRFRRYKNIDKISIPKKEKTPLVEIISYCLNADHYHLILYQINDDGISKFMQKIITAYTMYFNKKYHHQGPIFSGRFKSNFIENQKKLEYLSVYVNLNYVVHKPKLESFKLHTPPKDKRKYVSSWDEYMNKTERNICRKEHITNNFKSLRQYQLFSKNQLAKILENKIKELEK